MGKFLIFFLMIVSASYGQIESYTDSLANNYNSKSTKHNSKCRHAFAKVKPTFTAKISDSISATSGLIFFDNLLWTHNDHFDNTFYGMNLKGEIKKKIHIPNLKIKDWEDVAQDSLYLYIGDFGNNNKGNRKDLRILRIEKKNFYSNNQVIDTIAFSYSNQIDFSLKKPNTTDFDCEAFVIVQDHIYLVTKQWTTTKSSVYSLPKQPGNYIAEFKGTINARGLITGATVLPSKNGIVLCGYSKFLKPFVLLLYNYQNDAFWKGNIRKIKLKLPFHQVEAIATENGKLFYLTNESTVKKPLVNTTQEFHIIDLSAYLKD